MQQIEVDGIPILIEKKKMKNIYIRIIPPDAQAKITAPKSVPDQELVRFAREHLEWIRVHQEAYRSRPKQEILQYQDGDTIYLWGKPYRLEVETIRQDTARIRIDRESREPVIRMQIYEAATVKQREKVVMELYRKQLQFMAEPLFPKYEQIVGKNASEWRIKNMKTRWGTCNVVVRRVWLNLQLAKYPLECLEYVIVHELSHLYERGHNEIFWGYVERFYPEWKRVRRELNQLAREY